MGHIPGHTHIPTDIKVAVLLVQHAEHLAGQPLPQDVLNIDLKPEEIVGPGPCCRRGGGGVVVERRGKGGEGEPCSQACWPGGGSEGHDGLQGEDPPSRNLAPGSGSG